MNDTHHKGDGIDIYIRTREFFVFSSSSLEAESLVLVVLRQVMEEKLNCSNVEVACVRTSDRK